MLKAMGLVGLVLTIASSAFGQQFVEEDDPPTTIAASIRTAAEDKPGPFPALSAATPEGSLLVASGSFHDSDVVILVEKSHIESLKPKVLDLLASLNLRNTIIRIRRGRVIGELDMEFNSYMDIHGNNSHATLPLGQIVDRVRRWGLPEPFGVVIEGSKYAEVRYKRESIQTLKLLWPNEVGANDKVDYTIERHWYGLLAACLMGGFLLGAVGLVWVLAFKIPNPAIQSGKSKPKTLGEAQALYDQKSKKRGAQYAPFVPIVFVSLIIFGRPWMHDAENWIPTTAFNHSMPLIFIGIFLPTIVGLVVRKIRKVPSPPTETAGALRFLPYMMIPLLILIAIMQIRLFAPKWLYGIPTPILQWIIRIVGFAPIPVMVVALILSARKSTQNLAPGDEDYDAAHEMASRAGIRIRKVVVLKGVKSANAFARLFGSIGLTQGARDRLTAQERRCVIAHELGHIKGQHVGQLVLFSLAVWVAVIGMDYWATHAKLPPAFSWIVPLAGSPMLLLPLLIVARSPLQRKAEFAADRFALESIGSFTQVATALAKIHLLNASPHTFTKLHESIASHPSLVNRLNSLRATAVEMGMTVSPYEVDRIISSLELDDEETPSQPRTKWGRGC